MVPLRWDHQKAGLWRLDWGRTAFERPGILVTTDEVVDRQELIKELLSSGSQRCRWFSDICIEWSSLSATRNGAEIFYTPKSSLTSVVEVLLRDFSF